jgi:cation diffusion facilitator family transporter
LRSAYFHVLADALTSFTAIFALLAARYFGAVWLDPVMGIVGSILVANWSIRLLKETSRVLLDRQVDQEMKRRIVDSIQRSGVDRVTDLHLWSIGPDIYNLNVSIESDAPKTPDVYKALLPEEAHIVHSTVEVHPSKGSSGDRV